MNVTSGLSPWTGREVCGKVTLTWHKVGGRMRSFSWLVNRKGIEVEKNGKLCVTEVYGWGTVQWRMVVMEQSAPDPADLAGPAVSPQICGMREGDLPPPTA